MSGQHKIFVTRPYLPPREEYNRYLDMIWANNRLTNQGPLLLLFQQRLARHLGVGELSLTVNGHLALEAACRALDLTGEALTTPFTFVSTAHALTLSGLRPVFGDVREEDLTLDPESLEGLITEKTRAIIPVHVYGHPARVEKIEALAQKYRLKVIYDAAHAFGVEYQGQSLMARGDVSMMSFHATKLFHSIEGGALALRSGELKKIVDRLINFGFNGEDNVELIGSNAKMNEFQAAMGLCLLDHIEDLIQERRLLTQYYRQRLEGLDGLRLFYPDQDPDLRYNYAYLPVLIDQRRFGRSRDEVWQYLKSREIYARRYFYPLISQMPCYAGGFKTAPAPRAEAAAARVLCLPIYNGLTPEDIDRICQALKKCAARA